MAYKLLAKIKSTLEINALSNANALKIGELILNSTTSKLVVATGNNSYSLVGGGASYAPGKIIASLRPTPAGFVKLLGGVYNQTDYPALFAKLGLISNDFSDGSKWNSKTTIPGITIKGIYTSYTDLIYNDNDKVVVYGKNGKVLQGTISELFAGTAVTIDIGFGTADVNGYYYYQHGEFNEETNDVHIFIGNSGKFAWAPAITGPWTVETVPGVSGTDNINCIINKEDGQALYNFYIGTQSGKVLRRTVTAYSAVSWTGWGTDWSEVTMTGFAGAAIKFIRRIDAYANGDYHHDICIGGANGKFAISSDYQDSNTYDRDNFTVVDVKLGTSDLQDIQYPYDGYSNTYYICANDGKISTTGHSPPTTPDETEAWTSFTLNGIASGENVTHSYSDDATHTFVTTSKGNVYRYTSEATVADPSLWEKIVTGVGDAIITVIAEYKTDTQYSQLAILGYSNSGGASFLAASPGYSYDTATQFVIPTLNFSNTEESNSLDKFKYNMFIKT